MLHSCPSAEMTVRDGVVAALSGLLDHQCFCVFDVLIGAFKLARAAVQQLMISPLVSLHASFQICFHMHLCVTA